jgi:lipopolysaccharide transport system ATP-binding protein
MSNTVIKVENLSKQYRLGQIGTGSLVHDINRWWHRVRGNEDPYLKIGEVNDRTSKGDSEYVWSLRDINFEIKQGDAVGIIGRNGAGKSTLLKILSRTTAPTIGNIKIKGRVASLLEVGTGFHPELSGRENIFLNGAILGMTKAEIKKKFDEIVDFAGVERYIDTPVKRYSSGMYVRLAFGVAAHLEPEILIVDEVLAVGDAEFQKKALGKMQDVSQGEGRTVLFVSHNMAAVRQLCTSGLMMKNGTVEYAGDIAQTIDRYLNSASFNSLQAFKAVENANKNTQILSVKITDENGGECQTFGHDDAIYLELTINNIHQKKGLRCCIGVFDMLETLVTVDKHDMAETGKGLTYRVRLPENYFLPNTYKLSVALDIPGLELVDMLPEFLSFTIEDVGADANKHGDRNNGFVYPNMKWQTI